MGGGRRAEEEKRKRTENLRTLIRNQKIAFASLERPFEYGKGRPDPRN